MGRFRKPPQTPQFATSGVNVVEPGSLRKSDGWVPGFTPPPGFFNWLHALTNQWIEYLSTGAVELVSGTLATLNATEVAFGAVVNEIRAGTQISGGAIFVGNTGQIITCDQAFPTPAWTERTPAGGYTGHFQGVAVNQTIGQLVVAVGENGEIQTAPNNSFGTWTKRTQPGAYAGDYFAVAFGSVGLYCAVGTAGAIHTSPDGVTWTARTAAGGFTGFFSDVVWSDALYLFVAVGEDGEIQTSEDGITWTARTSGTSSDIYEVVCYELGLLAVGSGSHVWISDDASAWIEHAIPTADVGGTPGLFAHGGCWYLLGNSSRIAISSDRYNWRILTPLDVAADSRNFNCAASFGPGHEPSRILFCGNFAAALQTLAH
jgi:hypothetical protein